MLNKERANQHCADRPFKSGKSLGRHQMLCKSSTEPQHPVKPSRNQRCFPRFDRKTDCFDGGRRGKQTRNLGVRLLCERLVEIGTMSSYGCGPDKKSVTSSLVAIPDTIDTSTVVTRECVISTAKAGVAPGPTFKAVRGTQTRLDGFQMKYQPGSQFVLMVVRGFRIPHVLCAEGRRRFETSKACWLRRQWFNSICQLTRTTFKAFWQKSGIGMAAASPVPVREPRGKRKSVPGVIPMREKPRVCPK